MVDGYEIRRQIGTGGMATVYLARQRSMNRNVALKFLPSVFANDGAYLQRFEREVKIVSQLEHRNIVPVYDFGEFESQPYIAMRYMPAGSVEELLAAGRIPLARVLSIVEQVAAALDYAHQKGILHRDLKPSNILLDDGGGAFITDFGIARILSEGSSTITTQGVVGTPSYMSPEQARAEPLDGRSDVYSLGVMVFELVTGRRPFESDTPYGVAVMHVTVAPPSPRQFEPSLSAALETVILRALSKTRANRYESAGELAADLRRAHDSVAGSRESDRTRDADASVELRTKEIGGPVTAAAEPMPLAPPRPSTPLSGEQSSRPDGQPAPGRRRRDVWLGIVAGGALGCAALVGALILALPVLGVLPRADGVDAGATAAATEDTVRSAKAAETLAARVLATVRKQAESSPPQLTQLWLDAYVDATFTAEASQRESRATAPLAPVQPVGVRAGPTLSPPLQLAGGELVYFAERETEADVEPVFEIVVLDLGTWATRRFHAGGGSSAYPMPSPDGRWIVFQSNVEGDYEIYLANTSGGQLRQLTSNAEWDRLASWSPASDWIVYSADTRGDQTFDLFQLGLREGEPQLVYSDGWRNSHARISPDGRYLVFTSGPAARDATTWEIRLLDRGTGANRLLTDNHARDASPTFSPDSQRILYVTAVGDAWGLASMNLEGDDRRLLYTGPGRVWSANYSPDGRFIIATANVDGEDQLFLMDADGENAQQITTDGGAYASWIPPIADS